MLNKATDWLHGPHDISEQVAERRGQHLWATSQSPEPFLGGKPALPDPSISPPNVGRVMGSIARPRSRRPARRLKFQAVSGTSIYRCTVPGHEGMTGTLVVSG